MRKVVVELAIQPAAEIQFRELSERMMVESNQEDGCLTYRILKDLYQENEYVIYEIYKDEDAFNFHVESEHYTVFLNAVMPLLTKEPTIHNC